MKKPPIVELRWRDENYGSVAAVAAFRNYASTMDWTQKAKASFLRCVKVAGFAFNDNRASFVAAKGDSQHIKDALCQSLADAGFQISVGDVRAEQPPQ